jgi:hypothetical protein
MLLSTLRVGKPNWQFDTLIIKALIIIMNTMGVMSLWYANRTAGHSLALIFVLSAGLGITLADKRSLFKMLTDITIFSSRSLSI